MKTKIKFNGLEFSEIQDYKRKYCDLKVPKGWRKVKVQELWDLLDSGKADKFLQEYKGKYNVFLCEQTIKDKINDCSRWLYLGRNLYLSSYWDDLDYSYVGGRVVFVKVKK